jgi:hypothetical protein
MQVNNEHEDNRAELSAIRQKQSGFKSSRSSTQEKINALDANLKAGSVCAYQSLARGHGMQVNNEHEDN